MLTQIYRKMNEAARPKWNLHCQNNKSKEQAF